MPPPSKNLSLLLFIFSTFFISATESSFPSIGITYNSQSSSLHLPHQQQHIVSVLQSLKITSVRLPDSDPDTIRSFSYSGISLLLSIPNSLIPNIASNQSEALRWLNHHVTPFYPRVLISTISVGNDVLEASSSPNISDSLLSAVQSVRQALVELGIDKIAVSTTFSFINVVTTAFPPSSAEFKVSLAESVMKPLLNFLSETNSTFLINVYPYNLYRTQPMIPLGYAIFQESPFNFRDDLMTGVRYRNLFDMMLDSVFTAMALVGHEDVPIVVTETGWPSLDDTKDIQANHIYAEMYLKGLVRHLRSGLGTPLSRDGVAEAYIYELFDENTKDGSASRKRQWGILNPDLTQKYNVDFSISVRVDVFGGFSNMLMWVGLLWVVWLQYNWIGYYTES